MHHTFGFVFMPREKTSNSISRNIALLKIIKKTTCSIIQYNSILQGIYSDPYLLVHDSLGSVIHVYWIPILWQKGAPKKSDIGLYQWPWYIYTCYGEFDCLGEEPQMRRIAVFTSVSAVSSRTVEQNLVSQTTYMYLWKKYVLVVECLDIVEQNCVVYQTTTSTTISHRRSSCLKLVNILCARMSLPFRRCLAVIFLTIKVLG